MREAKVKIGNSLVYRNHQIGIGIPNIDNTKLTVKKAKVKIQRLVLIPNNNNAKLTLREVKVNILGLLHQDWWS